MSPLFATIASESFAWPFADVSPTLSYEIAVPEPPKSRFEPSGRIACVVWPNRFELPPTMLSWPRFPKTVSLPAPPSM